MGSNLHIPDGIRLSGFFAILS
ncbi:hypothetical protein CY0110_17362 [Crocosphaera chwakensis CCY0110]|uniref:Uncharacterized protein n=1 Tax=Crocosphaera chwakensis CCY0110 TaxID=391612 RepID=A3IIF4_9CHRO|nr:hypothetical protein CY0110_17362 [Crocosphaera chwakensis CCY0110]